MAESASYTFDDWLRLRNLSRPTGHRLINRGELRTYKVGSRRYVTVEADREFIQRKEREAAA